MLEKVIENKVTKYAKDNGFFSCKFVSPSFKGVPDRIFINKDGVVVFIEFKSLGKKLTASQQNIYDVLTAHNCYVYVADSVELGKLIIDKHK